MLHTGNWMLHVDFKFILFKTYTCTLPECPAFYCQCKGDTWEIKSDPCLRKKIPVPFSVKLLRQWFYCDEPILAWLPEALPQPRELDDTKTFLHNSAYSYHTLWKEYEKQKNQKHIILFGFRWKFQALRKEKEEYKKSIYARGFFQNFEDRYLPIVKHDPNPSSLHAALVARSTVALTLPSANGSM